MVQNQYIYMIAKTRYADFIKYLREERGLSQAEVANKTLMSRASYGSVEKGTKELTLAEAEAITQLFGITIDELLRTEVPNIKKYQAMLLAFVRIAKAGNHSIKKTKLAYLLYITDFSWFYLHDTSMSHVVYRKVDFGPVADTYFRLLEELEQGGLINIEQIYRDEYHMYEITETRAAQKKTQDELRPEELTHLEKIWQGWATASTAEIVQFICSQAPYQESTVGEIISYELIKREDAHTIY